MAPPVAAAGRVTAAGAVGGELAAAAERLGVDWHLSMTRAFSRRAWPVTMQEYRH
jgi:hypothetical protein